MNTKTPSKKPIKIALEKSGAIIISGFAAAVSVIAIAGLLTYGFWGEAWVKLIGKDISAIPHAHEEIASLQTDNAAQSTQIANLQNQLRVTLDEWQTAQSENLNAIQEVLDLHDRDLQTLKEDSDFLRQNLRQDPNVLSGLLALIRLRNLQGQALADIPALLKTYAGDDERLQTLADELQSFETEAIPSNYTLINGYNAIKTQMVLQFGESPNITADRDFFKNLKAYIFSLVKVRKLENINTQQSFITDNIAAAVQARDFIKTYELAKHLHNSQDDIESWLQKLHLRNSADKAIAELHEYLHHIINERLNGKDDTSQGDDS